MPVGIFTDYHQTVCEKPQERGSLILIVLISHSICYFVRSNLSFYKNKLDSIDHSSNILNDRIRKDRGKIA